MKFTSYEYKLSLLEVLRRFILNDSSTDVVFNLDGDLVIKPPEDCLLSYDNVEKNYLIVSDLQYEKITQLAGSNEVTSCQERYNLNLTELFLKSEQMSVSL